MIILTFWFSCEFRNGTIGFALSLPKDLNMGLSDHQSLMSRSQEKSSEIASGWEVKLKLVGVMNV